MSHEFAFARVCCNTVCLYEVIHRQGDVELDSLSGRWGGLRFYPYSLSSQEIDHPTIPCEIEIDRGQIVLFCCRLYEYHYSLLYVVYLPYPTLLSLQDTQPILLRINSVRL